MPQLFQRGNRRHAPRRSRRRGSFFRLFFASRRRDGCALRSLAVGRGDGEHFAPQNHPIGVHLRGQFRLPAGHVGARRLRDDRVNRRRQVHQPLPANRQPGRRQRRCSEQLHAALLNLKLLDDILQALELRHEQPEAPAHPPRLRPARDADAHVPLGQIPRQLELQHFLHPILALRVQHHMQRELLPRLRDTFLRVDLLNQSRIVLVVQPRLDRDPLDLLRLEPVIQEQLQRIHHVGQ